MLKQDVLRREQQKRLPNRALSRIAWQSSFPSSSIANVQSDEEQGHTVCCCSGSVSQKCRYALANSRKPAICHWKQIHGKRSHKVTRIRRVQRPAALRFTRRVQRPAAPSDACSIQPRSGSPGACSVPPCSAPSDARSIPPRHRTRAAFRRAQNAARLSEAPYPTALPSSSEPRQTKRRPREALLL